MENKTNQTILKTVLDSKVCCMNSNSIKNVDICDI